MDAIDRVLNAGLCTGCGLCASSIGEGKVRMSLNEAGFLRPVKSGTLSPAGEAVFERTCPAIALSLKADPQAQVHPVWGPVVASRVAWSADPVVRHNGSSGAGLSALLLHLLDSGQIDFAAHIAVDANDPLKNVVQRSTSREDIMRGAGSRYAPAAPLEGIDALFAEGKRFAFVGKPCDAAGMRAYMAEHPDKAPQVVAVLSFMCAGVPSLRGTDEVLTALGTRREEVVQFRYRGDGWPGYAKAVTRSGQTFQMDYNRSWGEILGKHLQLRCKLCPDGTGEFADVVCADAWHGKDGYPDFTERDGRSMLLTRTAKGERLAMSAVQSGHLVTEALPITEIAGMQPYQLTRKQVVWGRWVALWLKKGIRPRFQGMRLLANGQAGGWMPVLRNGWGTFKRLKGQGDAIV
jgi:coenzyme F420 hydrogenase subunit beta